VNAFILGFACSQPKSRLLFEVLVCFVAEEEEGEG